MLTEAWFQHLCRQADAILINEAIHDPMLMSISWLHVINEHPSNVSKYLSRDLLANLSVLPRFLIRIPFRIIRSLFLFRPLSYSKKCIDVMIFSHLLNSTQACSESDFYFGDLQSYLLSQKRHTIKTLINHTNSHSFHQVASPSFAEDVLVFPLLLGPLRELLVSFFQVKAFINIILLSFNTKYSVHPGLIFDCFSDRTESNIRFYLYALKLFSQLRPNNIILTFEGHAWERLAFKAARESNPSVRCIGYQHSVIFPKQYGIKRSLGSQYDPCTVVFAGDYGFQWFKNNANYSPLLSVVGTPRHDPSVHNLHAKYASGSISNPICIFLPDGTFTECIAFILFGIACAKCIPHVRFLIRFHPVISFRHLLRKCPALRHCPHNFLVSSASIEDDLLSSVWAIYRGSGSGVRAAMSGLRPLYFDDPKLGMSIDPLCFLSTWKCTVRKPADVASILLRDLDADLSVLEREFSVVQSALSKYFASYNLVNFSAVVSV